MITLISMVISEVALYHKQCLIFYQYDALVDHFLFNRLLSIFNCFISVILRIIMRFKVSLQKGVLKSGDCALKHNIEIFPFCIFLFGSLSLRDFIVWMINNSIWNYFFLACIKDSEDIMTINSNCWQTIGNSSKNINCPYHINHRWVLR